MSGRLDSNQRPLRPERSALPGCATARKYIIPSWDNHFLVGRTGQISNNFINDLRTIKVFFEQEESFNKIKKDRKNGNQFN